MTVTVAAERCGVTTDTFYRWIRAGTVPYIELPGGSYRITEAAVQAILTPKRAERA